VQPRLLARGAALIAIVITVAARAEPGGKAMRFHDLPRREIALDDARRLPPVSFDFVVAAPRVAGRSVVVTATLITPARAQRLGFFDFGLMLVDDTVTRRPRDPPLPPPVPPPPVEVTLPASVRLTLEAQLSLDDFDYRGAPTVKLVWVLGTTNAKRLQGTLTVQLPQH
jgi:hypothetical protein